MGPITTGKNSIPVTLEFWEPLEIFAQATLEIPTDILRGVTLNVYQKPPAFA
jgi:hypothetical protein